MSNARNLANIIAGTYDLPVSSIDSVVNLGKNRIINGAMMIDQRNGGAITTPTTNQTYTLDRWMVELSQASKFSVQQSTTAPAGFKNSLLITSLSSYSVGASDYFMLNQTIEGFNVADLGWGTANASTVTLSFWVRSSLTGTFGGGLENNATNRDYVFSYTINAANTWEQKSITIAGDTSGTWATDNNAGIRLRLGLGVGSSLSTTAGSWGSTRYFSVTGATSVVGTNGATFYITGVQLEKGSTANSFDYRPYGTELALCQRYFKRIGGTADGYAYVGTGIQRSTTSAAFGVTCNPPMRSTPSISISNMCISDRTAFDEAVSGISAVNGTPTGFEFWASSNAVGSQFRPILLQSFYPSTGYFDMSAEL